MSQIRIKDVTLAVAAYLAAQGIGGLAPVTSGVAITYKRLPDSPDRAVAVTAYDQDDELTLPNVEVMVQIRTRGVKNSRTDVDDLADDIAAVLDGRHQFSAGTLHIQRARRVSFSPQGVDGNGREERADNYALILMRS